VEQMPLRNRGTVMIRAVLASVALVAIFAAREVATDFPRATDLASAISADAHHDQRPRFDNSGSQWSAPAAIFVPFPPSAESTPLTLAAQFPSTLQTKGFHFNRPPPIS
jgi:hypothetical protein